MAASRNSCRGGRRRASGGRPMPRASRRPPGGLWLRAGFAWLSYSCVRACAACARINGGANSKWHLQQSVASGCRHSSKHGTTSCFACYSCHSFENAAQRRTRGLPDSTSLAARRPAFHGQRLAHISRERVLVTSSYAATRSNNSKYSWYDTKKRCQQLRTTPCPRAAKSRPPPTRPSS